MQRLYEGVVAQARTPVFYQTFSVPDTLDGRFDMVVFHLWPVVDALRDEAGNISDDGQALFDIFVADMEGNLRTIGVGDTSFPKKMKAIGRSFYGRFDAYRTAHPDPEALADVIARNVFDDGTEASDPRAAALAHYGIAMRAAAGTVPTVAWPDPDMFVPKAAA
ncbi:MAG: ubiquinol-cytochrome C chaperone family protein [Pseudomonadota bacterium]